MPERIEPGYHYRSDSISRTIIERLHNRYLIGIQSNTTKDSAKEFELLVIQIGDGRRGRKQGWEYLPRPEQWGRDGWTFRFHHECLNKVVELESKASQVQYNFHFDTR